MLARNAPLRIPLCRRHTEQNTATHRPRPAARGSRARSNSGDHVWISHQYRKSATEHQHHNPSGAKFHHTMIRLTRTAIKCVVCLVRYHSLGVLDVSPSLRERLNRLRDVICLVGRGASGRSGFGTVSNFATRGSRRRQLSTVDVFSASAECRT